MKDKLIELLKSGQGDNSYYITTYAAKKVAAHILANGVTVQEWVPVTERLPEESGEYLTYCGEYDGICILYCEVLKTQIKWRTKWKEVTHWQPLPEPPKGDNDAD